MFRPSMVIIRYYIQLRNYFIVLILQFVVLNGVVALCLVFVFCVPCCYVVSGAGGY